MNHKLKKVSYNSHISFLVSESDQKGNLNATLDLLMYGATSIDNIKLVALAKSARIIQEAMLKKITIQGEEDYVANHIIGQYDLHNNWNKESDNTRFKSISLTDFVFTRSATSNLTDQEKRAMYELQKLVLGSQKGSRALMNIDYNDKTEIFDLSVTTFNDELTDGLLHAIYDCLREFYIFETIGRPKKTYDLLAAKEDSLENLLNKYERSLAYTEDRTAGLIGSSAKVNISSITRELDKTKNLYSEVRRNMESIETILQTDTPNFQVLDQNFIPIEDASSFVRSLAIGLFLGGFLGSIYIIGRKIVRDAMAS